MTVSWGILATGRIAEAFATDLALVEGHRLSAVGSRSQAGAQSFVARHGASHTRAHGSYEALAGDPDVDVVYVATPHTRHLEDVELCLAAGKHVLCEKPLTMDESSTRRMIETARGAGLFLAEAMWMRTIPAVRAAVDVARSGRLGTITQVRADLGFVAPRERERLWRPELGADALLDLGIYPVTFAHLVLGPAEHTRAVAHRDEHGVVLAGAATQVHAGGAIATLSWTQVAQSDRRASIAGDEGLLEIEGPFHHPDGFTVTTSSGTESVHLPRTGRGYAHEIEEVGRCLAEGRTESALLDLDDSLVVAEQLARIAAAS